jgi:hypothetical protein
MVNKPTYKIHGKERRVLKKELFALKSYVNSYSFYDQLDKDMYEFYGDEKDTISDEESDKTLNDAKRKIKVIEEVLSIPYE